MDFGDWYFIILILALVWAAGWGIMYLIIRLAVTHALASQPVRLRAPVDAKAWETWEPKHKGDGGV